MLHPIHNDPLLLPRVDCRHHADDRGGMLALGYLVCEHAESVAWVDLTVALAIPTHVALALRAEDDKKPRRGSYGLISCPLCTDARALSKPTLVCAHDALALFGVETPLDAPPSTP